MNSLKSEHISQQIIEHLENAMRLANLMMSEKRLANVRAYAKELEIDGINIYLKTFLLKQTIHKKKK